MPARRILFVAHLSPPSPLSAARRVAGFVKHLGRNGHDVTVLTSRVAGTGPIEGAARVVRTRDLMVSRLNWRRGTFEALEGRAGTAAAADPSVLEGVVVPDLAIATWLPFALPRARRLERPDVVITTGPPPSAHLVGVALHRAGVPWLADVRDGWRFERNRADFPTAPQRALDALLEALVARIADRMTAVTEPIAADLRERLGGRAVAITNGFDPEEVDLGSAAAPDLLSPDRHSLLYTGRLAFVKRSPAPLLAGLRALRDRDPETARRVEVVFAGPLQADEITEVTAPDLDGMSRFVGSLDRADTLRLQRAADTLLLITTGNPSETGQKLYEYLAADRPVLVIGDRTEAARIVERAGAGLSAPLEDPGAIADAIARMAREGVAPPSGGIASQFAYDTLTAQLETEIEAAIRHHGASR
jgi:glycosyltransferase involved in cell wall biosynthesis